jgi:hypothetical protein
VGLAEHPFGTFSGSVETEVEEQAKLRFNSILVPHKVNCTLIALRNERKLLPQHGAPVVPLTY